MFTSRKVLSVVAGVGLLIAGAASNAYTLSIGDEYYVGSITPGIPSKLTAEAGYINLLIDVPINTILAPCGTQTNCSRVDGIAEPAGGFPTAETAGSFKNDNGNTEVELTDPDGYQYILAKYDAEKAGSLVWYFEGGFTGTITLPTTFNGQGLSHSSFFNTDGGPPPTDIPEPGTALLAGLALLSLVLSRKRRQA